MKKNIVFTIMLVLLSALTAFASGEKSGSTDWFSIIISVGYLGGVFVLLPIVIYTNLKEFVVDIPSEIGLQSGVESALTEEERNEKSAEILSAIENRLTPVAGEDGSDMITITKGGQARFMKKGLDYILLHLKPTNQDLIDRVEEFKRVYKERTKRVFTGSKWIIGCAVGVGAIALFSAGFSFFFVIHVLGLLFYILSSRTTIYGVEKRIKWIGGINSGMVAGLFAGLFGSMQTKYYNVYSDGSKERNYEEEMSNTMITIMFLIIIAIILGFFAAVLGVINFVMNYSNSFLLPFKSLDSWYKENFDYQKNIEIKAN